MTKGCTQLNKAEVNLPYTCVALTIKVIISVLDVFSTCMVEGVAQVLTTKSKKKKIMNGLCDGITG